MSWSVDDEGDTRFHRVTLIILRARQLHAGSPARVERGGHKELAVAAAEIRAGRVSWEALEAPVAR